MLLIDGKKHELNDDDIREFGRKMVWHVEPKPWDTANNKHGIGAGVGFPNTYLKQGGPNNGRSTRVTYYTHEEYDDTRKKTNYFVDNTGSSILIGEKGTLITSNAELNWFLYNNPHCGSNPLRKEEHLNPYKDKRVFYFLYSASSGNKLASDKLKAKRDLFDIISSEGARSWKDTEVLMAVKTINASAERALPQVILDWKEHQEEEGLETLRGGLLKLADDEPLWLKSMVVSGRRNIINRTINQCLENKESTGFEYRPTDRKYVIVNEKGKEEVFCEVPDSKNPDKFLLDTLFNDHKKLDKMARLLDKIVKE